VRIPEPSNGMKDGVRTRRRFVETAVSLTAVALTMPTRVTGQIVAMRRAEPYSPSILPAGIRSRFIDNVNGLRVHVLEAGFEGTRPSCYYYTASPNSRSAGARSWNHSPPRASTC
jgi:hypothetical protein